MPFRGQIKVKIWEKMRFSSAHCLCDNNAILGHTWKAQPIDTSYHQYHLILERLLWKIFTHISQHCTFGYLCFAKAGAITNHQGTSEYLWLSCVIQQIFFLNKGLPQSINGKKWRFLMIAPVYRGIRPLTINGKN